MNNILLYMLSFTLYTLFLLFWSKNGFKKTNTIRDFCVAGNSLGLTTSIFTFTATWFSAVSMQSVTGNVFTYGYVTILYSVVGWFLGASLLVLASRKIRDYDIMTIPEFFKLRYDHDNLQILGGFVIIGCYIFYIIIQIAGFGFIVSNLLDINYNIAIFLVYLFVVNTSFGGLFSVSRTDILNFVIVLVGILIATRLILHDIGNIRLIHTESASILSENTFTPMMVFTTGLAWGLGTAANPQYLIRILSAKDKDIGTNMISKSVIAMGLLYLCLMSIGIGARLIAQKNGTVVPIDSVLPYIISNIIDNPIGGLIFISVIASAVSTANSQLILLASSFTYDIYRKKLYPTLTNDQFITTARIVIFISGTLSLLLAIHPPKNLLIFGSYVWGIFAVTFMMPLYGGLFWKKATGKGAFWSSVSGLVSMALFYIFSQNTLLFKDIHPVFPGMIISASVFVSISLNTQETAPICQGDQL